MEGVAGGRDKRRGVDIPPGFDHAFGMCGRYTLTSPSEALQALFGIESAETYLPRWNIAPTQKVLWVEWSVDGGYRPRSGRWGLVPFFAKAIDGPPLINARSETIAEKPAFRTAFKKRRCLVVADGYFEWQKVGEKKAPYHIRMQGFAPFAMAGLFENWTSPEGATVSSCTLITTAPNSYLAPIHDRMPVILSPEHYRLWLDPSEQTAERLLPLLVAFPGEKMEAHRVSLRVNSPRNDDPDVLLGAG